MSQTNIHIDPLSTNCVLENLGHAIDEIKLVRSIENLQRQINDRNAEQLVAGRRSYLLSELRFLNKRLQSLRAKVNKK